MDCFTMPEYALMGIKLYQGRNEAAHRHINPELFFVVTGDVCFRIGEEEVNMSSGDFLVVPPYRMHAHVASKNSFYGCIHINHRIASKMIAVENLACSCAESRENSYRTRKIRQILRKILSLYTVQEEQFKILLNCQYYELLYYLSEYFSVDSDRDETNEEQARVVRIQEWMYHHFSEDIQLGDLAEYMHLTPTYLSRYFKRIFGVNFLDYLTEIRLEEVCTNLLSYPDRNVLRIAYDSGFTNMTSFHKAFKEHFQMTPGEYRNAHMQAGVHSSEDEERIIAQLKEHLGTDMTQNVVPAEQNQTVISCDVNQTQPLQKCWSDVVNVGRISQLLSADTQEHIKQLKKELNIKYVRVWDVYSEEMLLGLSEGQKSGKYDFTKLDRVFDFLVENGVSPYLDLGFKPYLLIETVGHPLIDTQTTNSFEELNQYKQFLKKITDHYCNRYGIDVVEQWYFEVWYDLRNEDVDYTVKYLEYAGAVRDVLKAKMPHVKIGGPGDDLVHFLNALKKTLGTADIKLPWDYISVYYFGDDMNHGIRSTSQHNTLRDEDYFEFWVERIRSRMEQNGLGDMPLFISEWNLAVSNRNVLNDSSFNAAYIVKNCLSLTNKVEQMGFWMASDLYAEYRDTHTFLFGGAGMLNRNGLRKPSFYAFQFLNKLGRRQICNQDGTLLTTNGDGNFRIVCHNYCHPDAGYFHFDNDVKKISSLFSTGTVKKFHFDLFGVKNGCYRVKSHHVNQEHGNIQWAWVKMQQPDELTKGDIEYLRSVSVPLVEIEFVEAQGNRLEFDVVLAGNEIRYLHIIKED